LGELVERYDVYTPDFKFESIGSYAPLEATLQTLNRHGILLNPGRQPGLNQSAHLATPFSGDHSEPLSEPLARDQTLTATFRQPFDLLAPTNTTWQREKPPEPRPATSVQFGSAIFATFPVHHQQKCSFAYNSLREVLWSGKPIMPVSS
jgi:hypothetical protein